MARVLLLGDEFHASLAAVRALGAAGHRVAFAAPLPRTYAGSSRAVAESLVVADPDRAPDAFADDVAAAAAVTRADVVLAGTESALVVLSERRESLPERVVAALPPRDVVELAVDKPRVLALATAAGLDTVPTRGGEARELAAAAGELEYPVVLKPMRSKLPVGAGELRYFRARRIESAAELREALAGLPGDWCVQPYLDSLLGAVAGVARAGDVLTSVHQRSERIWPPDAGYSSAAVTVPRDDALDGGVRRVVGEIGWTGVFQAQFLHAGESAYLIDLNPRPYGSLALAEAAGAGLVATWARLALGEPATGSDYRAGVRFRLEHNDAFAIARLARRGDLRTALAAALPRRGTAHGLTSLRDPGPLLVAAGKIAKRAARRG